MAIGLGAADPLEWLDGQNEPSAAAWLAAIWPQVRAADLAVRAWSPRLDAQPPRCRVLWLGRERATGFHSAEARRLPAEMGLPEILLLTLDRYARFPSLALVGAGPSPIVHGGFAVRVRRPVVLDRLRRLFEETWADARPGAERPSLARTITVRETVSTRAVGGDLVYARCLSEALAGSPTASESSSAVFDLTEFQAEAAARASCALETYGGAIIADSVGLGKTFIALALVERYLARGGRVRVVTPAALRADWRRELAALAPILPEPERVAWVAPPTRPAPDPPNLELRLEEPTAAYAPRLAWISTESLGRRSFPVANHRPVTLIVVDEAHQFRNPATRRYRTLARLARGARLALLTATPVNNSPRDLLHLLELFAGPGDFRDLGVADLRAVFREATLDAEELKPLLGTLIIRRTRPFVQAHYAGVTFTDRAGRRVELRFPQRAAPEPVRYDLAGTYGRIYESLEDELGAVRFAALEPLADRDATPGAVAPILRILLLKRMESSVAALRRSIARQVAFHVEVLRALREGRRLSPASFRRLFEVGEERAGVQLALGAVLPELPSGSDGRALARRVRRDLSALRRLHETLAAVTPDRDAKLHALTGLLARLRGEKVLLFSEFRDTARYLFRHLRRLGGVAQIDSGRAVVSGTGSDGDRVERRWVIERFAPRANAAPNPPERERIDLLIATDVLSEGLNLQDARHVVSYDLPWNPVRLIQRAGRVDRLGSPHDRVFVHHFVPEAGLERLLGLLGVLQHKLRTIDRTVGLEGPLLAHELIPDPATLRAWLARLDAGDGSALDELERADAEPFEWEERLGREFGAWCRAHPNIVERARAIEDGAVAAVRADDAAGAAFYFRAEARGRPARNLWLAADTSPATLRADRAGALRLFTLARDRPSLEPSPDFEEIRRAAWEIARRWTDSCNAHLLASDRVSATTPQGRALRWMGALIGCCEPTRLRALGPEIDRLTAALARRQPRGLELALESIAATLPDPPDESGLESLQRFLVDHPDWRSAGTKLADGYRLRAVGAVELRSG